MRFTTFTSLRSDVHGRKRGDFRNKMTTGKQYKHSDGDFTGS